jgi:hypothetical protein
MDATEIRDEVPEKRAKRGVGSPSEIEQTVECLYHMALRPKMKGLNVWI